MLGAPALSPSGRKQPDLQLVLLPPLPPAPPPLRLLLQPPRKLQAQVSSSLQGNQPQHQLVLLLRLLPEPLLLLQLSVLSVPNELPPLKHQLEQ